MANNTLVMQGSGCYELGLFGFFSQIRSVSLAMSLF